MLQVADGERLLIEAERLKGQGVPLVVWREGDMNRATYRKGSDEHLL